MSAAFDVLRLFVRANPVVRGFSLREEGQVELVGKTPNGLSASATLADGDRECQCYFASRRFPLRRRHLLFSQAQFSSGLYKIKLTANLCIALSSSTNAVSFSSERTMKRFPSSRCASAIQIVRPSESTAHTQPQLQPALLRLSAMTSQNFTLIGLCRFCSPHSNDKMI